MTSEKIKVTTQLRQLDEPLNSIEMYLNTVFNNSKSPIFIKDDECRLLLVNDAFSSMFGLAKDQIIGKTLVETVTPSEREHFLSIDRQVLAQGKEILCEETLTFSGEQTKIILTRKNRYSDLQGNYFLVGTIYDITERKQTELRETSRTHVLELITSGEALPIILASIVSAVEQLNPDMLCSILLLDNEGKHLLSGTASSLPDFIKNRFIELRFVFVFETAEPQRLKMIG
jgi:PAS domain S-box-containing protein